MDVRMPVLTGVEATTRIRSERPDVKVMILSGSDDEQDLFAAVRAGASGYLLKEVSIEELADAVRAVHAARGWSRRRWWRSSCRSSPRCRGGSEEEHGGAPKLTERELEVLRLVARGMSNKEIAAELVIAENTVKNHVRNILEKLQLRSRIEAAMYAVREKLVDPS